VELRSQAPGARLIISPLSLIEIQSVPATRDRTGAIYRATIAQLRGLLLAELARRRFEVVLLARRHLTAAEAHVRARSVGQGLRTLDAIQLSEALDLERRGAASDLVASDKRLCTVAAIEGLTALNPKESAER
jgi:hypothetical protein